MKQEYKILKLMLLSVMNRAVTVTKIAVHRKSFSVQHSRLASPSSLSCL